eukprot:CAMPEP_0184705026 /NCGR_PEP_ID=MMETSP0313-20130426/33046_1 /TAXON_ID=2792 /ORGANISM="Porphyridium aerugineum, Strain SAG 1380-2" /LENGTH=58 /DNA_ID=CAMNT_0027166267 /DNA_START=40 /DNA_END=213 /DNA_ORIENTATION=+
MNPLPSLVALLRKLDIETESERQVFRFLDNPLAKFRQGRSPRRLQSDLKRKRSFEHAP